MQRRGLDVAVEREVQLVVERPRSRSARRSPARRRRDRDPSPARSKRSASRCASCAVAHGRRAAGPSTGTSRPPQSARTPRRSGPRAPARRDTDERALLPQDRAVERLELGTGLDPELLDERAARVVIRARARPPAGRSGRARASAGRAAARAAGWRLTSASSSETSSASTPISRSAAIRSSSTAEAEILEPVDLGLREVLELASPRAAGPRQSASASRSSRAHSVGSAARALPNSCSKQGEIELRRRRARAGSPSASCAAARGRAACEAARPCSGATSSPSAADARPRAGRRDARSTPPRSRAGAGASAARAGSGRRAAPARRRRAPRASRGS